MHLGSYKRAFDSLVRLRPYGTYQSLPWHSSIGSLVIFQQRMDNNWLPEELFAHIEEA